MGNRLAQGFSAAAGQSGLHYWGSDLADTEFNELPIGLTTTREKFEQATEMATERR